MDDVLVENYPEDLPAMVDMVEHVIRCRKVLRAQPESLQAHADLQQALYLQSSALEAAYAAWELSAKVEHIAVEFGNEQAKGTS